MTLPDLRAVIATAPTDELVDVIGELEACKALAWARLTGRSDPHQIGADAARNASLTAEQLGAVLNVKPSCVLEWHRARKIPSERFGRFVRFNLDAVRRALATDSKMPELGARKLPKKNGGQTGALTTRLPRDGAEEGPQ